MASTLHLLRISNRLFAEQGRVNAVAANELGLKEGTPITYRAGDQPNNALSFECVQSG